MSQKRGENNSQPQFAFYILGYKNLKVNLIFEYKHGVAILSLVLVIAKERKLKKERKLITLTS